ncbi:hypothetical protein NDU88_005982 [Pleurodeles waltl]|uniref:Uncharacterized protein n=1 Tax=Pleurodeles waltl TaxID=8319 RepID=A0AAV7UJL3_PLEWA|nr:hypothetical protein NDU88_005982 [Pleurodeles waltl]
MGLIDPDMAVSMTEEKDLPQLKVGEGVFRKYFEEGLKTSIKEAVEAAISKRKRNAPSEEYFPISEDDRPSKPQKGGKFLRKTRDLERPKNTGSRRNETLCPMCGSLSTRRDNGVCCSTRESGVLHCTIDKQDSLSLDMFNVNDNEKGFDEFVFDPDDGPGAFGRLDDRLQGTSSTKPIKDPLAK